MKIFSLKDYPEYVNQFIRYFQSRWASPESMSVYDDCMKSAINSAAPLPEWYILIDTNDGSFDEEHIAGGVGLITNDFNSRQDLYPWLCALYVEENYRGRNLGKCLIDYVRRQAALLSFDNVYLATDHIGYYEHFGFKYIGTAYHPWGETSRIYAAPSFK